MKKFTAELSFEQGTLIVNALADQVLQSVQKHGQTPEVLRLIKQATEINVAMAAGLGISRDQVLNSSTIAPGKSYSLTAGQAALLIIAKERVEGRDDLDDQTRVDLLEGLQATMECNDLTPKQAYNLGAALGMLVGPLLSVNKEASDEAKGLAAKVNLVDLGTQYMREQDALNEVPDSELDKVADRVAGLIREIMSKFDK